MIAFSVRFNSRNAMLTQLRSLFQNPTLQAPPADGWWLPGATTATTLPGPGKVYFNMQEIGPAAETVGGGKSGWFVMVLYRGVESDFPAGFLTNKRVQVTAVFG
jgi:hypothetical protein